MTDRPAEKSPSESIKYAEGLGLNSVHDAAVAGSQALEAKHQRLLELRSRRRQLEQFRLDREMELTEEQRGLNPEMSMSAFEKHMKVAFNNDGDIRETRDELSSLAGEIDFVEFEIDRISQDIKIAVARLHELGGYFQFMAVVKQADEARKAREARESGDPW